MKFRAPDLKKAIKVAQDMGLAVMGYEIGAGGEIRVMTGVETKSEAEAELDKFLKAKNG